MTISYRADRTRPSRRGVVLSIAGIMAFSFALSASAADTSPRPEGLASPRVIRPIVDAQRSALRGTVSLLAEHAVDAGGLSDQTYFRHIIVVLRRPGEVERRLEELSASQNRVGSPDFHRWLTPDDLGREFGPDKADRAVVYDWLRSHGAVINSVAASGMTIDISASSESLRDAFGADMHRISRHGVDHVANLAQLSVPEALAPLIAGVVGLDDDRKTSYVMPRHLAPQVATGSTGNTADLVGPQDFATIYNLRGLQASGIVGTGSTIAVVGRSEIVQSDVDAFDRHFRIDRKPVAGIRHGRTSCDEPGVMAGGDGVEAAIDVEWAGAVAPGARVIMAACASTMTTDGVDLASLQAVELVPDVISVSFGECEALLPPGEIALYHDLWLQAALQGTTVVVAAGDSGAEACSGGGDIGDASRGAAVSGLASTPFNVAVGGTDFQDRVQANKGPGVRNHTYWRDTNNAERANAISYVPEMTWNETCATPFLWSFLNFQPVPHNPSQQADDQCGFIGGGPFYLLGGGGGGFSTVYTQPDWQPTLYGMPPVGARQMPDISLFAATGLFGHGLLFCNQSQLGRCTWNTDSVDVAGGTSFSAPAFAGVMALIAQKKAGRQGNADYRLYQLGLAAFGSSGQASPGLSRCDASLGNKVDSACVFHTITLGNTRQGCWTERHFYLDDNLDDAVQCFYGPLDYAVNDQLLGWAQNGMMSFSGSKRKFDPGYFDGTLGYSVTTGLGSPNVGNLVLAW